MGLKVLAYTWMKPRKENQVRINLESAFCLCVNHRGT